MLRLQRSRWLTFVCCLWLVACSRERVPNRREVLERLVTQVAAPDVMALGEAQAALSAQLAALSRAPDPSQLTAARQTWLQAQQLWDRVALYPGDPVIEARTLLRTTYWPVRVPALETLLRSDLEHVNVESLGVDVRGMFAVEWLLFGPASAQLQAAAPSGNAERTLASALAAHLEQQTRACNMRLGDGKTWQAALTQDEQQSVNRLVNTLLGSVEALAEERTNALQRSQQNPRAVRGGVSNSAPTLIHAQLSAASSIYTNLSELVRHVAPDIDRHLKPLFATALTTTQQLSAAPSSSDRALLTQTRTALKQLEQALKAELPNALGVTLTFESGDGD